MDNVKLRDVIWHEAGHNWLLAVFIFAARKKNVSTARMLANAHKDHIIRYPKQYLFIL